MNLALSTVLLLAASSSPHRSEAPPVDTEPPSTLLDVVHESTIFDTSMPFYEMQKQAQRATTKTPAPTLYGSSRAQRRASGDRRSVKQIIASQKGR